MVVHYFNGFVRGSVVPRNDSMPTIKKCAISTLLEKYGPYTIAYDEDISAKRIKTLRNKVVSNTAVWIISSGAFPIQERALTWKVRRLFNTEFTEGVRLKTKLIRPITIMFRQGNQSHGLLLLTSVTNIFPRLSLNKSQIDKSACLLLSHRVCVTAKMNMSVL